MRRVRRGALLAPCPQSRGARGQTEPQRTCRGGGGGGQRRRAEWGGKASAYAYLGTKRPPRKCAPSKRAAHNLGAERDTSTSGRSPAPVTSPRSTSQPEGMSTDTIRSRSLPRRWWDKLAVRESSRERRGRAHLENAVEGSAHRGLEAESEDGVDAKRKGLAQGLRGQGGLDGHARGLELLDQARVEAALGAARVNNQRLVAEEVQMARSHQPVTAIVCRRARTRVQGRRPSECELEGRGATQRGALPGPQTTSTLRLAAGGKSLCTHCATEKPASSMSWSTEKPTSGPMSTSSRRAASRCDKYCDARSADT